MLDSCLIDVCFFAQADEIQSVDVFFKRRDRNVARSPLLAARKVLVPSKLAKVQESLRASFALRKPLKASSRWLGHACINCKQAAWFLQLVPQSESPMLLSFHNFSGPSEHCPVGCQCLPSPQPAVRLVSFRLVPPPCTFSRRRGRFRRYCLSGKV